MADVVIPPARRRAKLRMRNGKRKKNVFEKIDDHNYYRSERRAYCVRVCIQRGASTSTGCDVVGRE